MREFQNYQSVAYNAKYTLVEEPMEPNAQSQSEESDPAMEGDDLLDQASGGKGALRNAFQLD
jgi:hypothetical protein